MGSNTAAADLTIARIPAAADFPVVPIPGLAGSGSGSSSSSSSAVVQPRMNAYSVFQVLRALVYGAPVIAVLEDGYPAGAEERQRLAVLGRVRGVVVGTVNSYLRACGRIPIANPEGPFDLNAAAAAPTRATQLPTPVRGGGFPLICAYCNCAFCFGVYEVPWLIAPPGYVCAELAVPAIADFVTLPAVEPLYCRRALPGPSSSAPPPAALLLVCSNRHHFMVAMCMLRRARGRAPSLVWRRPSFLGVVPAVVRGAGGGNLQLRRVLRRSRGPPPPRALAIAGTS